MRVDQNYTVLLEVEIRRYAGPLPFYHLEVWEFSHKHKVLAAAANWTGNRPGLNPLLCNSRVEGLLACLCLHWIAEILSGPHLCASTFIDLP